MMINILTVANFTLRALLKSKIIITVIVLIVIQVSLSFIATEFTFGVPQKVALDIGLGLLSLSLVGTSIFLGLDIITKEIENKMIYLPLSRSLKRYEYILGRILGMSLLLGLKTILGLSFIYGFYFLIDGIYTQLQLWNGLFIFFEALIIFLFVILFSQISNKVITILLSLTIFIFGHIADSHIQSLTENSNQLLKWITTASSSILPNLEKINIKNHLLYEGLVPNLDLNFLASTTLYSIVYILSLSLINIYIFNTKDLG